MKSGLKTTQGQIILLKNMADSQKMITFARKKRQAI
jgi:hypothetical protein